MNLYRWLAAVFLISTLVGCVRGPQSRGTGAIRSLFAGETPEYQRQGVVMAAGGGM
jgi:hypothetical protein